MAVDWRSFEDDIKSYFETLSADNISYSAKVISNRYDIAVRAGGELLGNNFVVRGNKEILTTAIVSSFIVGMSTTSTYNSLQKIGQGLVGYWTAANLSLVYPPPGSVAVVSNMVTSPGTFSAFNTFPVNNYNTWIQLFISMAKIHLLSMSGLIIALVPTMAGPIPTPFPWIGYK